MDYLKAIIATAILLQLLWICYTDIRFLLITNQMVMMVMATAVVLGLITNKPNGMYELLTGIYPALIILAVGFVLFCLRVLVAVMSN